jgi:hypothetical protein
MTYQDLIRSVSEIVNNDNIYKNGLILTYELEPELYQKINNDLFIRIDHIINNFEPSDEFEVEIGGILIKFIKK